MTAGVSRNLLETSRVKVSALTVLENPEGVSVSQAALSPVHPQVEAMRLFSRDNPLSQLTRRLNVFPTHTAGLGEDWEVLGGFPQVPLGPGVALRLEGQRRLHVTLPAPGPGHGWREVVTVGLARHRATHETRLFHAGVTPWRELAKSS